MFFEKPLADEVDDPIVPIDAAEFDVAGRGERRKAILLDAHQRHVERAAAEIVNQDRLAECAFGLRREKSATARRRQSPRRSAR